MTQSKPTPWADPATVKDLQLQREAAFRYWAAATNPGARWTDYNVHLKDLSTSRMVRVWRMETPDGSGAYSAAAMGAFWDAIAGGHYNPYNHPGPMSDGIAPSCRGDEFYYGFTCPADLRAWFFSESGRVAMAETRNCFPTVYRVAIADIAVGGHQCVFKRARSRRETWLRPDSLERLCAGSRRPDRAWDKLRDWPSGTVTIRDLPPARLASIVDHIETATRKETLP
jgi:hypothetical protein